jgi:hypothetical protein
MPEHEHDGFYWEPTPQDDLRQGDLLFNVPIALMPQQPRFVFGPADEVMTQTYADYPDNPPSDQIVVEARFGVLGMVVTPTCHVSEGEKDEDVVAVVPVEALNLVIPDIARARSILAARTCRCTCSRCRAPTSAAARSSASTRLRCWIDPRRCEGQPARLPPPRAVCRVADRAAQGDGPVLGTRQRRRQHRARNAAAAREAPSRGSRVTGASLPVYAASPSL